MTKLDEARQELGLAVLATTHGNGQEARMIVDAHEALAREIARDEFAKLSPAPVGEDPLKGPCSDKCMAGIECDNACLKVAPTPPAEGSDGGETDVEPAWPQAPRRVIGRVVTHEEAAATAARIADLEARLAEARRETSRYYEGHAAAVERTTQEWKRAEAAESALTDARKRIGALEAGVTLAASRLDFMTAYQTPGVSFYEVCQWAKEARALLTAPASPETPEGQA